MVCLACSRLGEGHNQLSIRSTGGTVLSVLLLIQVQGQPAGQTGWRFILVLTDSSVPWTELLGALLLSLAAST